MLDALNELFKWQGAPPLAILFSGFFGAAVATIAINSNRNVARRNAAIKFIFDAQTNYNLRSAFKAAAAIHQDVDSEINKLVHADASNKDVAHIRYLLNYYESMAVAIHHKAIDEQIIKENRHSIILRLWMMCEPFVEEDRRRAGSDTIYQDLEILVERWRSYPLRRKQRVVQIKFLWMSLNIKVGPGAPR